jgi:hypothetical protein
MLDYLGALWLQLFSQWLQQGSEGRTEKPWGPRGQDLGSSAILWVTHGIMGIPPSRILSGYPDLSGSSVRRSPGPLLKLTHFYYQILVNGMNLGIWKFADGEKK